MISGTLPRRFFARASDAVARDLIGSHIEVRSKGRTLRALIVETEAYGGVDDPASHAFRGPTPRCEVMFGPAGFLYVYRSYGVHWCMNVVTETTGVAGAVLLRGAVIETMTNEVGNLEPVAHLLRGPGTLTRGLAIDGADNGIDCCARTARRVTFQSGTNNVDHVHVGNSPRIGISKGQERRSRYFLVGHRAVSGSRSQNEGDPLHRS
jgi:DNA-3-methyladenine glycosylase